MNVTRLTYGEVKALKQATKTNRDEFIRTSNGFPLYNTCTHTLIDLSDLSEDPTTQNDMHTLSVKLPNGDYLTIANVPYSSFTDGDGCIDVTYHGAKRQTHVVAFNRGKKDERVRGNFYSLVYEK